jgi:hypothetical protein
MANTRSAAIPQHARAHCVQENYLCASQNLLHFGTMALVLEWQMTRQTSQQAAVGCTGDATLLLDS